MATMRHTMSTVERAEHDCRTTRGYCGWTHCPERETNKCQGCGTTLWSGENLVCSGCIIDYDTTGSRFV